MGRVMQHLSDHKTLVESQHGFRCGMSCETQLVRFINDLQENLDGAHKHKQTDLIIMDFAKAFDKQTAQQATPRSPVAMVTEQPVPSPIQNMPHVNILSDSHLIHSGQNQEDLYNNTTVMQDETIPGGFTQSQGGFLPNMGDLTDSDS